ncbi:Plant non-specific lipid-transfer protein/Par allergen protein [Dioscorea alata]|uniref:Plant non-specific lipid-transfer protein/Par allergen protein n=1 Tax=Dioscorea alata TaxID=55571 RepID=A0ACB7TYX7_DIOAL|nr:Plant non-specific lipid-transfer protein/Par allergen protein [Dioscorea alata]
MAPRLMQILLIFAFVWMFSSSNMETMAQTSSNSCTSELANLLPCLNYITANGSKDSKPSSSCCTPLASVVQSQPLCLCLLLNGTFSSSSLTINQSRALELPGACNVNTPSTSLCHTSGGPSSSPNSPSTPTTPSGGGSNSVIPSGTGSSNGSWIQAPLTLMISIILIVSYSTQSMNFL